MGRRGPRSQSVELKIARGNPGDHKLEPEPQLPAATAAPADATAEKHAPDLAGAALAEWDRLRQVLIDAGVLTTGDEAVFLQYCRLVGEIAEYETKVVKVELEDAHRLGYAGHLMKLRNQFRQFAAELGLTPSSRSGVKVAPTVRLQRAQATDKNEGKRRKYFGTRGRSRPA